MEKEIALKELESTRWINLSQQNYINQVSIDCVIFGYKEKELKVLIPKINFIENVYTLPGGFILHDEGIDKAALRILNERTGIHDIYLEQYRTFGHEGRKNIDILNVIDKINEENNDEKCI
jgi:ADP-ribose pyrophosphatase YjhB (NUDIX family)